jgi:hypothetical protein
MGRLECSRATAARAIEDMHLLLMNAGSPAVA